MAVPIQRRILEALEKIDRPGTFCTSGVLPSTLPGLNVTGVGPVGLPLAAGEAAALKKVARQAPYGQGTRTLVDTSVRNVWEIDAEQVRLENPDWSAVVGQAVETLQVELGLERRRLEPHLYKLLLYEPGSFFLAHRDGEKLERMVATLVIGLPAAHEGGELVVRHEGSEKVVDFSPGSRFRTQFAAFYADCEHEIRPVRSGRRLALVYNLTLEKSSPPVAAPSRRGHVVALTRLLQQWAAQERAGGDDSEATPSKLAALLEHRYTPAGLTRDVLKGTDRTRADVLFAAAREADCDAHLALVTYWESGTAEPADAGYRSRRGPYDDDDDVESHGHVMGETLEDDLTAACFSDSQGRPQAFGELPLDEDEIVSRRPLREGAPDSEAFEDYTGNAGMTLERWYRRAAVVLWPAASRFEALLEGGIRSAVGGLEQMVEEWKAARPEERSKLERSCRRFARRVVASWPERRFVARRDAFDSYEEYEDDVGLDDDEEDFEEDDGAEDDGFSSPPDRADTAGAAGDRATPRPLLDLLEALGDVALISAWIREVLSKDVSVRPGAKLGDLCERRGWSTFRAELHELFDRTDDETVERHAELLADFALREEGNVERERLCVELAQRLVAALERWEPRPGRGDRRSRSVDLRALVTTLTPSLLVLDARQPLERLVSYVLERRKAFDWTTVQIPALLDLQPWLKRHVKRDVAPLRRWLAAVVQELEARAARPPQEPADWRRASVAGCSCVDCQELSRFLDDPRATAVRLPLVERRRRHLHEVIDCERLDTTHVTERRGRPYTLVCTKTKASYERALQAHRLDLEHLTRMRELLEWHDGLSARRRRGTAVAKPGESKRKRSTKKVATAKARKKVPKKKVPKKKVPKKKVPKKGANRK